MRKLIKTKFIKRYWYDVIQTNGSYSVFNTQRKKNQVDREGIGYEVERFETIEEADKFLEKYKG